MTTKSVLIFGGSFSPPTLAHEAIIAACLRLPGFDEVWLLPSADRADKSMSASQLDRLAMLQIIRDQVFASDPRLKICSIEFNLPKPASLNQTYGALRQRYPHTDFWFAFGGDAYRDMPNWPQGMRLRGELNMIIFSDQKPTLADGTRIKHLKLPKRLSDISSTHARAALRAGANASRLMHPLVLSYVKDKKLY